MKADLHIHSDFSDSSRAIDEIIALALENKIEAISIVDHDTTETFEKIKKLEIPDGLKVLPGLEISAFDYKNKRKVHLLCYSYKSQADHINKICRETLDKRNKNSEEKLRLIEEAGYKVDYEKIKRSKNSKNTLYKQHIMAGLTDEDFDSQAYQDLYKSIFKNGGICHFDIAYPDVFEVLEAVLKDGGIPVLAHPGELDSFSIVPDLVERGLRGIEVYHPSHDKEDEERALKLAKDYDIIITGGSDDHGAYGKKVTLGLVDLDEESILRLEDF